MNSEAEKFQSKYSKLSMRKTQM